MRQEARTVAAQTVAGSGQGSFRRLTRLLAGSRWQRLVVSIGQLALSAIEPSAIEHTPLS